MPLEMPILDPEPLLVAGPRRLHFAWRGGRPPFRFEIVHDSPDWEDLEIDGIGDARITTSRLNLSPGIYRVSVADRGGNRVEQRMTLVEQAPRGFLSIAADYPPATVTRDALEEHGQPPPPAEGP